MIQIKNLDKTYKKGEKKALNNVSLNIESGIFGLLGHNGAGKSTLMNILTTLLEPSGGEVVIDNIKVERKNYNKLRELIGYLPQEFGVYPNLTVEEALDYFGILYNLPKHVRKERIEIILNQTNLADQKNKSFKKLSGGMKRRLGLGIALINNPQVLIVDEPTSGVDPDERIRIRNLLLELSADRTVILSTHIIEDISYTCKKLAVLNCGELKYFGTIKEMISKCKNLIWEIEIEGAENLKEINKKYSVLSSINTSNQLKLKILSTQKPTQEAVLVEPTLEDAYMAINRMEFSLCK